MALLFYSSALNSSAFAKQPSAMESFQSAQLGVLSP
jgi:hypothetical protein